MDVNSIIANASNVRYGENPPFTLGDFLSIYPQFGNNSEGTPVMPAMIIQMYIDLGLQCIQQNRWRGSWKIAISYFVAHYCTLFIRQMTSADDGKDAIAAAGQAQGITTSESVDGVSYSVDVGSIMQDLNGFAGFKSTEYGLQLATMAKMYGKGGMVVW